MLDIVIGCCKEVANLMGEFADFRHSKKLKEGIIHINTLEEEADSLFISSMRALHAEREDVWHGERYSSFWKNVPMRVNTWQTGWKAS